MRLVLALLLSLFVVGVAAQATSRPTPLPVESMCAAPNCVFKNGTECNRLLESCPRCVRFDWKMTISICAPLQRGSTCQDDETLCPETPLEHPTNAVDDNGAPAPTTPRTSSAEPPPSPPTTTSMLTTPPTSTVKPTAPPTSDSAVGVIEPKGNNSTPLPPPRSTSQLPSPTMAGNAATAPSPPPSPLPSTPSPSEATSQSTSTEASPTLPPWLVITLSVGVTLTAALLITAVYVQSRRIHSRVEPPHGQSTTRSYDETEDPFEDSKNAFSPNSHGMGGPTPLLPTDDPARNYGVSSRSFGWASLISSSSTNESVVPASFAMRDQNPHDRNHQIRRYRPSMPMAPSTPSFPARTSQDTSHGKPRRTLQSLPPLQPRTRTPTRSSSPRPISRRSQYEQYSFPRLTDAGDARVPPESRSWTTNDFDFMDEGTSSDVFAACDDGVDAVFLTDHSGRAALAECDFVERTTAASCHGEAECIDVDIYPDTSMTTLSASGRMFSPLSMRTRDTAAVRGDVLDTWASHRASAPSDLRREQQQQQIAQWKAKFYLDL